MSVMRISPSREAGQRAQLERALEIIVASAEFRGSQRSVDFLTYVVRKWLDAEGAAFREKTIATEVFGRPATYDPAADSFVRVKASDLRRRLAEYYKGSGRADSMRIEIPLGGYHPQITVIGESEVPAPEDRPADRPVGMSVEDGKRGRRWALAGGLTFLCVASAVATWLLWPTRGIDRFWAPLAAPSQTLLISLPALPRFEVSASAQAALLAATGGTVVLPAQQIHRKDDVVGMGAASGAATLAGYFAGRGRGYRIRIGQDVRYADLRSGPAVLLGGFSSSWTLTEMTGWRFRMASGPPGSVIDAAVPGRVWRVEGFRRDGRADRDVAIVTRVVDSTTGQALVALGGVTTFGTQAAAEFVTNEAAMADLLARAPEGWAGRNLQAVVSMRVKDDVPGPAKLEAVHFW